MGLYEVADASAKTLASMIQDVIVRCGLDISNLRGQGYDGCSTMAGRESGVAKRIQQVESRAVFVHCAAHSMNLAIQDAATAVPIIRDCLSLVHELVIFFRNSPTRSRVLQNVPLPSDSNVASLKPLCPTRWSVRAASIASVLKNYDAVLQASLKNTKGVD